MCSPSSPCSSQAAAASFNTSPHWQIKKPDPAMYGGRSVTLGIFSSANHHSRRVSSTKQHPEPQSNKVSLKSRPQLPADHRAPQAHLPESDEHAPISHLGLCVVCVVCVCVCVDPCMRHTRASEAHGLVSEAHGLVSEAHHPCMRHTRALLLCPVYKGSMANTLRVLLLRVPCTFRVLLCM